VDNGHADRQEMPIALTTGPLSKDQRARLGKGCEFVSQIFFIPLKHRTNEGVPSGGRRDQRIRACQAPSQGPRRPRRPCRRDLVRRSDCLRGQACR
jgi:hypothetical protein